MPYTINDYIVDEKTKQRIIQRFNDIARERDMFDTHEREARLLAARLKIVLDRMELFESSPPQRQA